MSLQDNPLLLEFKFQVKERIKDITQSICTGKCTSFDDYRNKVGRIEGLNQSLELMSTAIKDYMNDEDEE